MKRRSWIVPGAVLEGSPDFYGPPQAEIGQVRGSRRRPRWNARGPGSGDEADPRLWTCYWVRDEVSGRVVLIPGCWSRVNGGVCTCDAAVATAADVLRDRVRHLGSVRHRCTSDPWTARWYRCPCRELEAMRAELRELERVGKAIRFYSQPSRSET